MDQEDPTLERAKERVGQVLRGKWRLDALLGVGGMACVYAATHRNKKRGALKLLHPELSANTEIRQRFLREGYVANTVEHPGAVSVLDDDVTEDGTVFLVMELLEGQSVQAWVEQRPNERAAPGEVVALMRQLLEVLAVAHDKGIVHRDLKPENLFLTHRGELKVLDFGIARLREGNPSESGTKTGGTMGTPAFLPPEQACGYWDRVDARTDLWAVGATMFTLLTGKTVHQAETLNTLLLAAMTRHAPPLASVLPEVPPKLAAIVDRALAFSQDDRWPSARAMFDALAASEGETMAVSVGSHRPSSAKPGPPRWVYFGAAAASVLAVVVGALAFRGEGAAPPSSATGEPSAEGAFVDSLEAPADPANPEGPSVPREDVEAEPAPVQAERPPVHELAPAVAPTAPSIPVNPSAAPTPTVAAPTGVSAPPAPRSVKPKPTQTTKPDAPPSSSKQKLPDFGGRTR